VTRLGLLIVCLTTACQMQASFVRAEGVQLAPRPAGSPPAKLFINDSPSYPPPFALLGSPPLDAVGIVKVKGTLSSSQDRFIEAALREGAEAGCDVLVELAVYQTRIEGRGGKTRSDGMWESQLVCGVAPVDGQRAPPELPYPNLEEAWVGGDKDQGSVACQKVPQSATAISKTQCLFRTRLVSDIRCNTCSAGYVNDLDLPGFPLRVRWKNRAELPVASQ
jgi:hypothetical protein